VLLPLKVLAPAEVVEHMPGWSIVSISLGIEQDREQEQNKENGYGLCVAVLVNPALAEALAADNVTNVREVSAQVLDATRKAVGGFLGQEED